MGDLTQEIGDLLGEDSPPETSDETRGTEKSPDTSESGESGGENQSQGQEAEATEAGPEGEQSESEGVQEEEVDSEEEESSEEDPRDTQIRQLQAEVNRLSKGEAQESESESSSESEGETSQETKSEPFDPFMGQDFDSIIESKESFQKWAEGLYERAKKDTHEEVLKRLPDTVSSYVKQQVATQKAVDDFYSQNDDLAEYKNYVGQIANEVQAEHSDWTFDQILEETAQRARKTLGLKEKAKNKGGSQQRKPALSGGTKTGSSKARSGSSGEELSDVEKSIQELLPENE